MAGMSDGKTDNWKRISRLVNTRQDGPCDERPSTRSNPQQLTTNHMSEHILKASIWYTGRQNWSSHGVIHASGSERHWRWKQGSKHQLPFDQSVAKDAQSRHTNLAMTWIDYKKAYNSMPYSWTLECLRLYKIKPCLVTFIRQLMAHWRTAHWRTTLFANSKNITDTTIKWVYIEEVLCHSCCWMPCRTRVLINTGSKVVPLTINHLLYSNDIKLYAKNEQDISSLIHLTRVFSSDISMTFSLAKCGGLIVNIGKVKSTNRISLSVGQIDNIDQSYKCFKRLQSIENNDKKGSPQSHFRLLKPSKASFVE